MQIRNVNTGSDVKNSRSAKSCCFPVFFFLLLPLCSWLEFVFSFQLRQPRLLGVTATSPPPPSSLFFTLLLSSHCYTTSGRNPSVCRSATAGFTRTLPPHNWRDECFLVYFWCPLVPPSVTYIPSVLTLQRCYWRELHDLVHLL